MVREAEEVAEFLGQPYNFDTFGSSSQGRAHFQSGFANGVPRAGEAAPDFTLPTLDEEEVQLSSLEGCRWS